MIVGRQIQLWQRISTLLLIILTTIAGLVLIGLVVMMVRLLAIQSELGELRDSTLPRLVKLSRLSQEASATIAIAPALSAKPTRFEFETLLSRIKDKESSQKALISEIGLLMENDKAAKVLSNNGKLLRDNLQKLTDEVRQQIAIRKNITKRIERFQNLLRTLVRSIDAQTPGSVSQIAGGTQLGQLASTTVYKIISTLLDPNDARFSRNKRQIETSADQLASHLDTMKAGTGNVETDSFAAGRILLVYWNSEKEKIYSNKILELSSEFKVKALVEENSLIANRLLTSANNEFHRANDELKTQIQRVEKTTLFTLITIVVVVVAFGAGNTLVWIVLRRRVFKRLQRIGDALQAYAENRNKVLVDPIPDEIGEISDSLVHYMTVIDEREAELAEKTQAMETLSNQLAKYLSPQVYDSIFRSKQEVTVRSSRKKLTVFFSDIAGFTETADRLESEELTQLLNRYLTEMSQIALEYGATIDKYVGDAILIFFGDPESRGIKEDALVCVKMAIAMRERLRDLQHIWRESGIERPLQCRMGIHTDYCTVGNFGSETRMDYTIIGGGVNLASRLETSAEPGEILISYETYAHVSDIISCEERGHIEVKGIAYPVAIYQVVDLYENLNTGDQSINAKLPHLKLDVDVASMSAEEIRLAVEVLQKATDQLSMTENGKLGAHKPSMKA